MWRFWSLTGERCAVGCWCIRQLPFLNCTQHSPAEELFWWLQTSFSMSHKAGDELSVTNWTREGEHDYLNERRMGWHKRTWIFQNPGRRENVGQSSPVTFSICTQGGKSTLHERLGQAGTWPWCSLAHTVVFMPDRRISKTVRFPFVPNHKEKCTDCKKPPNNCHRNKQCSGPLVRKDCAEVDGKRVKGQGSDISPYFRIKSLEGFHIKTRF